MGKTGKIALWLFALGAVLGSAGDLSHVISGTTAYPPQALGWYLGPLPFWVPLLFGAAGLAIGFSHLALDPLLGSPPRPGTHGLAPAIAANALFLGLYFASGFLPWETGGLNHLVLAAGAISIWAIFDRTWQGIVLAAGTGAAGTSFEMTLVHHGVFSYGPRAGNFHGVAVWLPWLYAAGSVAVGNLARVLSRS